MSYSLHSPKQAQHGSKHSLHPSCNPKTTTTTITSPPKTPHSIVLTLEHEFKKPETDLSTLPSPGIFHTHIPYSHLPDSIKTSDCKIVYVTRNPKDVVVSNWHFFNSSAWREGPEPYPIEKVLDEFCEGVQFFGPFLDHVMEYWFESLKRPEKVMVLKYEDMKRDPKGEVKKLGEFVGRGVLSEEEVEEVIRRTSFDRLKNLEVNKNGVVFDRELSNSLFFRRGVVGDWKNHFSDEMKLKLEDVTRRKLQGSGFDFDA